MSIQFNYQNAGLREHELEYVRTSIISEELL